MAGSSSPVRDTATALLVVVAVLGGLYLFAGTWPPMVVVESRSMMHPDADPGYGNLGTADPGDIVAVRSVGSRDDIRLAIEGGDGRYGGAGDVIVFFPDGDRNRTPIIHRAITYVEVEGSGDDAEYRVFLGGNDWQVHGSDGIYMEGLGIDEDAGYTREDGWRPPHSGLLTQGDNPETNPLLDQVASPPISEPVRVEWVKGVARGELPWLGLVKLAFGGDVNVNPPPADWVRFGNAYAPADLWIMLFASGLTFFLVPLGYDVYHEWRRTRGIRFPPYLTRLRQRYGGGSSGGAGNDPEGGSSGGGTTFQVVSSAKGGGNPERDPPSGRPEGEEAFQVVPPDEAEDEADGDAEAR